MVSSGTWSLVGTELPEPVIHEIALQGNLTNEVGAFGKITLLRNNAGMFINQRLKPEYEAETGEQIGWSEFSAMAEGHAGSIPLFDVNAARFFNPASMSGAIRADLQEHGGVTGTASWPTVIRSYQVSLACSYAQVCATLEKLAGKRFPAVYIAGGGSRNLLQNQTVADVLGPPGHYRQQREHVPGLPCGAAAAARGGHHHFADPRHPAQQHRDKALRAKAGSARPGAGILQAICLERGMRCERKSSGNEAHWEKLPWDSGSERCEF